MLLPTESVREAKALIDRGVAAGFRTVPATAYYLATSEKARNTRVGFFPRPGRIPGRRLSTRDAVVHDRCADPFPARHGEEPVRPVLSEVEEVSGRARRQEHPAGDTERVFPIHRLTRELNVAAIARQQQDATELPVVDKRRAIPAYRRVELISRRILGIVAQHIPGDEAGFADPVEELIASLLRVGHGPSQGDKGG